MILLRGESSNTQDIHYNSYRFSKPEKLKYSVEGMVFLSFIGIIFYRSLIACILAQAGLPWYLNYRKRGLIKKRQQQLTAEFKECVQSLAGALKAGYSVENAWREAAKDTTVLLGERTYLAAELKGLLRQMELNVTVEEWLECFGERAGVEDIKSFSIVFSIAKRGGGDFIRIIESTVRSIGEKIEVGKEIDMIMSGKQLEHKIMSMIPFGIICYMQFSFPGFMDVLYGNLAGMFIMTICLLIYFTAFMLGEKVIHIEV